MAKLTLKQIRNLVLRGVIPPSQYLLAKRLRKITYTPLHGHGRFNLSSYSDRESNLLFRFTPEEIIRIFRAMRVPRLVILNNGARIPGLEALCILLRRLCYPNRLSDICKTFGRDITVLSRTVTWMVNWIYRNYSWCLQTLQQQWMTQSVWSDFAEVCSEAGSVYPNIVAFIDGTCRPICRPSRDQKKYYSGYYKEHVVKYQGIMLPNGLIGRLDGAYVGRRHDAAIIHFTKLNDEMKRIFVNDDGTWFAIYGDSGYANQKFIKVGFKNCKKLTEQQLRFNRDMSNLRISVEWGFGKLVNLFAFLDFRKTQKVLMQPLNRQYFVAALLTNMHTCVRGSVVSDYFNCPPLSLEKYLSRH